MYPFSPYVTPNLNLPIFQYLIRFLTNPGSKGRQHFPALKEQSGLSYDQMLFFDDCTFGDNCGDVARQCPGTVCVRTPQGLDEERFEAGLRAFASGDVGVV